MRTRWCAASCQPARSMSSRRPSSSSAASQYTPSIEPSARTASMSSTGCSTNVSTPSRLSRLTSASATPPWSGITATRVPAPKVTPVGTHAFRSGRSAATGTRRGIRSVAAMSPVTVGVEAASLGATAAAFSALGGGVGAGVPVLSRIQPTTWVRVGKSRSLRLSSRATL